jgi:hypothetical protein
VKEDEERRQQERQQKHMAREIVVHTGLNGSSDQDSFKDMMRELAEFQLTKKEKEEDDEGGWKLGERPEYDARDGVLQSMTDDLELRSYVAVSLPASPDE